MEGSQAQDIPMLASGMSLQIQVKTPCLLLHPSHQQRHSLLELDQIHPLVVPALVAHSSPIRKDGGKTTEHSQNRPVDAQAERCGPGIDVVENGEKLKVLLQVHLQTTPAHLALTLATAVTKDPIERTAMQLTSSSLNSLLDT